MTKTTHWYEDRAKEKKNAFKKDFFKLLNNNVFEKIIKIWESMEITNLQQPAEEEII